MISKGENCDVVRKNECIRGKVGLHLRVFVDLEEE